MDYRLVKDYKHDTKLRLSFHELTENTFGFSLEEWYQNGFWGDDYIPYSLVDGDKVIANVSVNRMKFHINGDIKTFIQLGTVMTDQAYRRHGLGRYLIEAVLKDYLGKSDGIYLFANDSVLDYYPKFGFRRSREYRYKKPVNISQTVAGIRKVDLNKPEDREKLLDVLRSNAVNSAICMDNFGLFMFWLTGPISDQIYFCERENCYLIASVEEEILNLQEIIAEHTVNLDRVVESFGKDIHEVVLGFVPLDLTGYEAEEYKEDDCTLFIQGQALEVFNNQKLRFPALSHA